MYKEVLFYRHFVDNLPSRIKKSNFKASKFVTKTGISKASFYKKLRENSFNLKEVEQIAKVLYAEEMIDEKIRQSEADIAAGRTLSASESAQQILQKLN